MQRPFIRVSLLTTLLFTAACTQHPAPIEMLGQNTYGRDGVVYSGNSSATHVAGYTTGGVSVIADAAPAAPITSSELTPPVKTASAMPVLQSPKPASFVQASNDNPINPWTGRPHFSTASAHKGAAWPNHVASKHPVSAPVFASAQPARPNAGTFMWPVDSHHIISAFGPKGHGLVNDGINIAADNGEPVWAAGSGEVVYVGNELAGYGNMVLIRHPGDKTTAYAHLGRITVDKYQHVKQGDIIGYVGSSGNVRTPQLHFAVREGNQPVDPTKYLSTRVAGL